MRRFIIVADVHLTRCPSDVNDRFPAFLANIDAARTAALYVLGDLFDVWLGDDDDQPIAAEIRRAFRRLSEAGVPVFIQHGNRDFMLGMRFMTSCGASLLPDAHVLESGGERWLLMHGDLLVRDARYLRYRRIIRNPLLTGILAALPLSWRRRLAGRLRAASRGNIITAQIDDAAAAAALRRHGCKRLLHGHLHKAGKVVFAADGGEYERWCLPAWDNADGCAEISGKDGLRLIEGDSAGSPSPAGIKSE